MELGFSESMAEPPRSGALKRSAGSDFSSDLNMLCFSSSSSSPKTSGCYSGASASVVNGVKGPFTPSQWLELEQQALIYKYITANAPIPAHLLFPICKALESAGFLGFNAGTLRQSTWGWGPFHLGYGGSADPEPGRCRRTDGKKWRCSRDAVADHKYCERHMNRGRHRSRKHVEASGAAAAKPAASLPSSPAAPPGGSSNSFDITQHYHQAKTSAVNPLINRMNASRGSQGLQHSNDAQLSFLPSINLNNTETSAFSVHKHQDNPYGFLSSYTKAAEAQPQPQHSLYPFMDEWPKAQPDHSSELHQATRLSMGLGSWESSIGGPLGEALHSKSPALNLMPTVWEGNSGGYQQSASSPTGVLQRSAVVSVSNSSAGSSPRAVESHEAALAAASRLLPSD